MVVDEMEKMPERSRSEPYRLNYGEDKRKEVWIGEMRGEKGESVMQERDGEIDGKRRIGN